MEAPGRVASLQQGGAFVSVFAEGMHSRRDWEGRKMQVM